MSTEIIVIDRPDLHNGGSSGRKPDSGYRNGFAFATKQEALDNAHDLMLRWILVRNFRAVESDEPANYSYVNRQLRHVGEPS